MQLQKSSRYPSSPIQMTPQNAAGKGAFTIPCDCSDFCPIVPHHSWYEHKAKQTTRYNRSRILAQKVKGRWSRSNRRDEVEWPGASVSCSLNPTSHAAAVLNLRRALQKTADAKGAPKLFLHARTTIQVLESSGETEGSLDCATRRAKIRRGRKNRVAPLGMTMGVGRDEG